MDGQPVAYSHGRAVDAISDGEDANLDVTLAAVPSATLTASLFAPWTDVPMGGYSVLEFRDPGKHASSMMLPVSITMFLAAAVGSR